MTKNDEGLGLIEIVISMFLIALLAIAFVPVIISGVRASALNSTSATATRLVAQAIDAARTSAPATCAAAQLLNASITQVDAQGTTIRVVTSVPAVSDCADGEVMTITVVAFDDADDDERPIADARTQIYLGG
ncbi:type IV pilus modification PilV family protein [Microcella humidisoli]|uniref:Prepilin-type N-terminal cleavage/methylation domain-containing protein n=1 Tax=Microcella humidisoli TaxID=2963406 RepID=A0ABY5FST8_9MICO|nr:hypothetical protein [Microcella humidisoli]UTT61344.1 hypothetical protein NNL39_06495 [Microcella humidisoli]